MFTAVKRMLILACVLIMAIPLHAQNGVDDNKEVELPPNVVTCVCSRGQPAEAISESEQEATNSFLDLVNQTAYADTLDKKEEKRILREKWKELLKVDIFYSYFKAKEVEAWVTEKVSIDFPNVRGRAKFEDNQIKYTFKIKF